MSFDENLKDEDCNCNGSNDPNGIQTHVHAILTNTDFFEDHHHELGVTTGLAINVGGGKHIHLATGVTTIDDGHNHSFIFTTLIQDPLT